MPVWPGEAPLDIMFLQPQRNTEIAIGFLTYAIMGTGTLVAGLAATPTSPASMRVVIAPGIIITQSTLDTLPTGFGSLSVDNSTPLMKTGINISPVTMSPITAPATAGQSQNWVLEALFQEADSGTAVLPYYNAASPLTPFSGPSNSGAPVVTNRSQSVALQWVAGVAATTGTQLTPAVTPGWSPLYIVTTTNGVGTITSSNITIYPGAPFLPTTLPALRQKLTGNLTLFVAQNGSDGNSGLSSQVPFATPQQAWNQLINLYDLNGFNVVVQMADGTYTTGLNATGLVTGLGASNTITFQGNVGTPSNVVISVTNGSAVTASAGGAIYLTGMQLQASGTVTNFFPTAIAASNNGAITLGPSIVFGQVLTGTHIYAAQGKVGITASYTIAGSALVHHQVDVGGLISAASLTIAISGSLSFTTAFAFASRGGLIQYVSVTFTGSATGPRYSASLNGIISSNGTTLPGSTSGATATGGQYA